MFATRAALQAIFFLTPGQIQLPLYFKVFLFYTEVHKFKSHVNVAWIILEQSL